MSIRIPDRSGRSRWRDVALAVCAAIVIGALAGPSVRASATPSSTTHPRPGAGVAGVTRLCGPDPSYGCTTGGYAGQSTGWSGARYGAGYASSNSYGYHNCTLYAAYRLATNGLADPGWAANATDWDTSAAAHGVLVDQNPALGSIAQWNGGSAGHVAYVEVVTSTYIEVTDDNFELNYTDRWRITTNSPAWPDNFIHFRDLAGGVGSRLLGDVNGDNKADAVVMFRDTGTAMVALSTGSSFGYPGNWSYGHSVGASRYFLADANGDAKADLVAFFAATGRWTASLSSGSGFWAPTDWAAGHGVGTTGQWVIDATGDHRSDVVTFDASTGDWWVSTSSGSGFWSPARWITGHGVGSSDQTLGDVNYDGKADAAIYVASSGAWYVGLSTGSAFGYPGQWSAGHGAGSSKRLVGDVDGGGRADAAYFWAGNGRWQVGTSAGSGFWTPTEWAYGHGVGTTEQFLADVTGDGRSDMITFDVGTGDWWVSASSGSGFWSPARWISGHGAGS